MTHERNKHKLDSRVSHDGIHRDTCEKRRKDMHVANIACIPKYYACTLRHAPKKRGNCILLLFKFFLCTFRDCPMHIKRMYGLINRMWQNMNHSQNNLIAKCCLEISPYALKKPYHALCRFQWLSCSHQP